MLIPNPSGNYHFLPGIEAYSSGVVADAGYEIVHGTLDRLRPYREGFARIEEHLRAAGRDLHALCAVELRSPAPFSRAGFVAFNAGYRELLQQLGLLGGEHNPIARTNVAPAWLPPSEPALFGFSYTVPAGPSPRKSFVVAGAGELRRG